MGRQFRGDIEAMMPALVRYAFFFALMGAGGFVVADYLVPLVERVFGLESGGSWYWLSVLLSIIGRAMLGIGALFSILLLLALPWTFLFPRASFVLPPLYWLLVFFLLPFVFVFVLSFSVPEIARPPYQPVFQWVDGSFSLNVHWDNYVRMFTNSKYTLTYLSSLWTAFISTVFCLIIGYPMAYTIARAPESRRNLLLMLVILPFWTSFLLRVYSLIGLMQNTGQINTFLLWLGVIDEPIQMLKTDFAVYVGIVYSYLPFMILPLYANLVQIQDEVLEASADLGASPLATFWQVTVPLSFSGIIAGSMLVFIPAVGEFVIPDLLGGPNTKMIGKLLWVEFFNNRDWPMASALASVMLVLLVVPFLLLQRWQTRFEEQDT